MRYYTDFEDYKNYPKDKVKYMFECLMDLLNEFNLLSFEGAKEFKKGITTNFILQENYLNDNGKLFMLYSLPKIQLNPNAYMESNKLPFVFRNMYLAHSINTDQDESM